MKRAFILLILGMSIFVYASDKEEVTYTKDFKSYMNKDKMVKENLFFIDSNSKSIIFVGIKIKL